MSGAGEEQINFPHDDACRFGESSAPSLRYACLDPLEHRDVASENDLDLSEQSAPPRLDCRAFGADTVSIDSALDSLRVPAGAHGGL